MQDAQEPFMYAGKVYVEHLHKWFDIAVLWANLGMGEVGMLVNWLINISNAYHVSLSSQFFYLP